MNSTTQRVALVTAASTGLGSGIASELADHGFSLVLQDACPAANLQAIAAPLLQRGANVICRSADITQAADRQSLMQEVGSRFGRLDALVLAPAASVVGSPDILSTTEGSLDTVMGEAVKGPFFLTQLAARWMIEQHQRDSSYHGTIIFVSSLLGDGAGNRGDRALVRPGVAMAAQLWAHRLASHGISVHELRTGLVDRPHDAAKALELDQLVHSGVVEERRWGTPQDVGRAAAMLASGNLTYATGNILNIDGGLTLRRL
ncbi:MAG: SDR family oxidoreductase [Pirellulales bacterium]|nr:SDR family oxidoreductase [Pirellulales bacterium]